MTGWLKRSALGIAMSLGALCGTTSAQEVVLKFHLFNTAATPVYQRVLLPWGSSVSADSKGRIKVEMYPSMGLGGKPPELINQVRDGIVDLTFTLPTFTPGRFPVSEVFELPSINADAMSMAKALQDFYAQHLRDGEFKDFHMLAMSASVGSVINSVKPIKSMDDLKGMSIRTSGLGGTLFLESVGATPVPMAFPDIASALSKGVIQAALLPYEILPATKLHELTKYHVTLDGGRRFNVQVFIFLMNKARYNSLPPDLKKVIDDNSGASLAETFARCWIEFELLGEQAVRNHGNTIVALSRAESDRIEKASGAAVEKWITQVNGRGIDGRKMVDAARASIAKYRGK